MCSSRFLDLNCQAYRPIPKRHRLVNCHVLNLLHKLRVGWNKRLCQPEGEGQLGSSHQKLGGQSLEEAAEAFLLRHVGDDAETALLNLEVSVLYPGLDNIHGCGDDDGGTGTCNGSDKVLAPGCFVVVFHLVEILFCGCGSSKELQIRLVERSSFLLHLGMPTANDPGKFRAIVHPQPLYSAKPSSATILRTPRPLKASGLVCRLILRTSKGSRTTSPTPIRLHRIRSEPNRYPKWP